MKMFYNTEEKIKKLAVYCLNNAATLADGVTIFNTIQSYCRICTYEELKERADALM